MQSISYEMEINDPHVRERMRRKGHRLDPHEIIHQARYPHGGTERDLIVYPPSPELTDTQKFLLRQHPHDYLAPNFQLGYVVKDRGEHQGLDAQALAMKQSMVALHRRSGFIRDNESVSQDWRDNPQTIDDQVRVIDEYPITAGEYFVRPLTVQYDRIAAESFLNNADPGFLFYREINMTTFVANVAQRFPAVTDVPDVFNFNNPIDRIEIRNRSAVASIWMIPDRVCTAGGNGEFEILPGEARGIPVRAYKWISLCTDVNTNDRFRLSVYAYKDSHATLLNSWQRYTDKPTGAGMHPNT